MPRSGVGPDGRRTLFATGINHALHDGCSDVIYILLPVWQAEFALGYAALALLRATFVTTLAALQMPSTRLAKRFGPRRVMVGGTLVTACGFAAAGLSGGILGLGLALGVAGMGSSTQHPLASAVIARTFGGRARGPLGTYNFAGDVGKASIPLAVGLLVAWVDWRMTLWLVAGLGLTVAILVGGLLSPDPPLAMESKSTADGRATEVLGDRAAFRLLVAIGMLDNVARPAFLLYLPFLLQAKGAGLSTIGLALSLVFGGGALGKAACGWLGQHLGVTRTVLLTETGTALLILAVIGLPLGSVLPLLPFLGVMLNGTSSVLYGTVPDLAPDGRVEHAFAIFYTCTLGGSALAMPLFYGRLGDLVGPGFAASASAATALAVVPLMLLLSHRLPIARQ